MDRRDPPEAGQPDYGDSGRSPEDLVSVGESSAPGEEAPGDAPDVELGAEPLAPPTDDGDGGLEDPIGPSG